MHNTVFALSRSVFAVVALVVTFGGNSSAQSEKILYTFTGLSDGGAPQSALISDSKGNLYGTTQIGGSSGSGTVFELSPGSNGNWSEQVLYSFSSANGDGIIPSGGVVFDSKGNLYGTTSSGGTAFQGTVYQLSPGANGIWTEKVLYSFSGSSDGGFPVTGLVLDNAGNVYGTTDAGGVFGFGVVFELVPGANGTWSEKVLHSFTGGNDGAYPYGSTLIFDRSGNLYGATPAGGFHDYGVVFKLTRGSNGTWTERVLHAFTGGSAGSSPLGSLVFDGSGNLYGVSVYSVFELTPCSNGTWKEKALHNFTGSPDGAIPESAVIFDKAGNLYGTTNTGGSHRGTVFELMPVSNGVWTEKVLHRFASSGGDGVFPGFGSMTSDTSGNLYGTTPQGGIFNMGVVFQVTP